METAKGKKRRKKIIVFSGIVVVLAALGALAIFRKRDPVITIQTEKVVRRNVTEVVRANGTIQPVTQVKISPEVSGEIIALPVKEGQYVQKGDLIFKIKPDAYQAAVNQSKASYQVALAGKETAGANLVKAEAEFKRERDLYKNKLVSDSDFDTAQAAYDVAKAQLSSASDQVEMAQASLASAQDSLDKTTVVAPISGTVSQLNVERGERVVGTAMMAGSDVMTIADLTRMEARVDVGEMDVVLIKPGQHVKLEVDAFKDRKFDGTVTNIAYSAEGAGTAASSSQEAIKFQVRILIQQKEAFRPGMSVTAAIETRMRTNVLTVPIASVTTRLPVQKPVKTLKNAEVKTGQNPQVQTTELDPPGTNGTTCATNSAPATNASSGTSLADNDNKKAKEPPKPIDVVFVLDGDHVKMVPVKIGICNDDYWEITDGLKGGEQVVSGGYRAISRELQDGSKVRIGHIGPEPDQQKGGAS